MLKLMMQRGVYLRWTIFLVCASLLAQTALAAKFSADQLITSARAQIGVTTRYDASYRKLKYPGGDVPIEGGVCTDVVIRALRGQGVDLQQLVHVDMQKHFDLYPKNWGLKRPDAHIDHRRVPNLQRYFSRRGWALKLPNDAKKRAVDALQPGDLVTWMLPGNLPHIGIVSDQRGFFSGRYLILHNVGRGTQEEDVLEAWPQTGHYRLKLD
jgi:uncharacterized protein